MHSHHVPAYVEEVRRCFEEAYAEAHLQTSSKADRQKQYYDRVTSTVQLMLGDVVLINLDMFQDKRKVKDWWSEAEYVVMCQVTDDMPTYEVLDDDGNVKVIHNNRLFLVAPTKEDATSLGGSESVSEEGATQSTSAELTPLEWGSEMPESEVDEVLTQCLTSHIPLGWVDGILQLLPSVALRPTLQVLGTGDGMWSLSDKDVH